MSKEQQQPPSRLTLEQVIRMARQVAFEKNGHPPTVIVDGSDQVVITHIEDLADSFEGRRQQMFVLGFTLAQNDLLGVLQQVFLVSEAWLSRAPDKASAVLPSQDPERQEVLLICGLDPQQSQMQIVVFRMLRDPQGKLTELQPMERAQAETMQAESPLLWAFVYGYAAGLLGGIRH